ncbi:conserved hypothetical protein [Coccidioides posadasii str. Silveira]|uniref:Uncharacterized protein n=1 Tax=Coccidioides posadasii (strain RMSCC 757 / Silveira) TaxID=443226 RepID=E9DCA6_COCPS|nr:conserved hypothetical protein [Coccidioides posadasii str. Silveira]
MALRGHGVSCIPIQTWPSMWRLSKALDAWKLVDRLRTSRRGIYPRQYPGRFASSVQQLLHVSRAYSLSTNSRMRSVSMRRMFSDDHAFRRSGLATDLQACKKEVTLHSLAERTGLRAGLIGIQTKHFSIQ